MPDVEERERIWQVQLHARKTPLASDVDFRALAEKYTRSGGDIKNAVLKAAQIATVEPGPDAGKRIHQHHFIQGMEEVIAGESVMSQSLFDDGAGLAAGSVIDRLVESQDELRGELALLAERVDGLAADRSAARAEQARQQAQLIESLGADRKRKDLTLIAVALGAAALAIAALAASVLAS
jgi:hypothetical protein